jgi:hypothetical protein
VKTKAKLEVVKKVESTERPASGDGQRVRVKTQVIRPH